MSWDAVPQWAQYLAQGLLLFALMASSAVVLSRAGKNPYWALFTVIPYVVVAIVWVFAWSRWPKVDSLKDSGTA
jgi:hypothetical protein